MRSKRILCAMLALALVLSSMPALAASYHSEVRVKLSIGSKNELNITPVGEFYVVEAPKLKVGNDELTVKRVGGRVSLTVDGQTITAASITLASRDYGGRTAYIRLKNSEHGTCTYLGNITFDSDGGRLRAINKLPMDQYLYGVVPNEMSNSFPIDALMAQAICARSYAMAKCSKYPTRSYDLGDTSSDQVYCGYASKNKRAIAAVEATTGKVLTYDGDIIEAFYSSSNGGQTEKSSNVWQEDYPYYVNADDPFDLQNASSMEYLAFLPAKFTEATVALMDRDVYTALLTGARKAVDDPAAELVSTLRVFPHDSDYAEPSRTFLYADVTMMVKKADGTTGQATVTLTLANLLFDTAKNTLGGLSARTYTLRMRGAESVTIASGENAYRGFNLTMRRYGHGVGLSQRGAQERARAGIGYNDILGFYYVGTTLVSAGTWDTAPRLTSGSFKITQDGISGMKPKADAQKLVSLLKSEGTLSVVTSRGALREGEVTTGDFVRTTYDDCKCMFDLPIIIYGDIDGEPGVTEADAAELRDYLIRDRVLAGPYLIAADVNHDGTADARDLLYLVRSLCGDESISQEG